MNSKGPADGKRAFVDHTRYSGVSDEELVERVKNGERELYEVIMRRYNQQLYRVAWSYLEGEAAVKDSLQSAWVKAWENLDSFRGEAQLSTWLVRITINEALQTARSRKRRPDDISVTDLLENHQIESNEKENPAMETERKDFRNRLEEAIAQLPPKYRSVFVMREMEEMSTRETADCLELTTSNVKVRLHRARNMLREHLEEIYERDDLLEFKGARCDAMVRSVMNAVEERAVSE